MEEIDDDGLWRAVTALYDEPGVAGACLAAQDGSGVDVLLVLSAAVLARRGRRLGEDEAAALASLAAPWQRDVVRPLRALRRQWRPIAAAAALREELKALELAAERQQLSLLAPVLAAAPAAPTAPALLATNVDAVLPAGTDAGQRESLLAALGRGWRPNPGG